MSHSRHKSDRRDVSMDVRISEKPSSKDKYLYDYSDTERKREKRKKSKRAKEYYAEPNSESDADYESKKENKKSRKHKHKKSSKEKFEGKHRDKDARKYVEESDPVEEYRSRDRYERDISSVVESHGFKNVRKRSRSQERQRYGKWAEENDKNKDVDGKARWNREEKTDERSSKRRKNYTESKYEDSYDDEDSHRFRRSEYNTENYYESNKSPRKEMFSDRDSRHKNRHEKNEETIEMYEQDDHEDSPRFRKAECYTENYHKSNKSSRKEISPDRDSRRKKRHQNDENSSQICQEDRHSRTDNTESIRKSRKRDRNDFSSNKHDKDKRNYENNVEDPEYYYKKDVGTKMRRTEPYVGLDDPNRDEKTGDSEKNSEKVDNVEPISKRDKIKNINMRTGGAYIPPARLRMMQDKIQDKSSEEYQRIAWEALKKSIIGMTNKVNSSNLVQIVQDLFKENIIRGRGVLSRAIMQAQAASPTFTKVYAALLSIINTKFPIIGELVLKRLIVNYKRGFRRNDKTICINATRFMAHLLNQEVVHEILILEIVTHLLENPTEDSVEIAIATLKECGKKLTQLSSRGMRAIVQRVREVLHEGSIDSRVRYMIEVFFAVLKDGFKDFETIPEELDLVEDEEKYTHFITLDDVTSGEEILNIFNLDPNYLENEEKYKSVAKEILGDSEEEGSGAESDSEGEEEDEEEKKEETQQIVDMTETNVVCLRRKIYLTIQSSLDFEECAHKLLKLELLPGQILEMCYMILDCCAQQRTYEKFFGLLAQRFCQLNKVYVEPFTEIFENSYKTIHRLETNKLRNVAKFFAHLLYTDAISWEVLSIIKLNEEDTSSSSRIFIKILFQELSDYMGLPKLNERVKDVTLQAAFDGLFPRDDPHNTRFAINFFTSIGLGGLTDELREHLKNLPKNPIIPVVPQEKVSSESSSVASSSSSSSSSSESSSSDSE